MTAAMVTAVRKARFRLVFLSSAYLKSVNCRHELEALRGEPGKTLFLVYHAAHLNALGAPLGDASVAAEAAALRAEGHLVRCSPPHAMPQTTDRS